MPDHEKRKGKFSKKNLFLALFAVIIVGVLAWSFGSAVKNVVGNFKEVQFALKKPALVKSVRLNYEKKQKEVDESILNLGNQEEQINKAAEQLRQEGLK